MISRNTHLLWDLTGSSGVDESIVSAFSHVASTDCLGGYVTSATVLVGSAITHEEFPSVPGWSVIVTQSPLSVVNVAFETAADNARHLLVMLGPHAITSEAVGLLSDMFAADTHFGVSVPRFSDAASGEIWKLSKEGGDPELKSFVRRAFIELPDIYLLPEFLAPCFLIRDTVVANLPLVDENFETLNGAIQLYLSRVRRAGFRTFVANHAVIPASAQANSRRLLVSRGDTRKLHQLYPDVGKAKEEFNEHSLHRQESLLGRYFARDPRVSRTLLVDVRGVPGHMNGTAEAVLALCDGLKGVDCDWNISLLAEEGSAKYHDLRNRYAEWPILTEAAGQYFTAALRPSQPWYLSTMLELHNMALWNFFAMLDTIAWDILFEAPRGLAAFWDFMCQHADGLLFNSFSTRGHFMRRFPLAQNTPGLVFHHSFDPKDYAAGDLMNVPGKYIFIIGSGYDHKHLGPTVDLLSSAFPFQRFKVLGLEQHRNRQIEVIASGRVPEAEIDRLFSEATLIVFPSLYEGFGLPTIRGLSYGRTVIARRSELLNEIASYYRGPGTLLDFATPAELVDTVGRCIHEQALTPLLLGQALGEREQPKNWRTVASGVLQFIELQLAEPRNMRWRQRETVIRQLEAFCS